MLCDLVLLLFASTLCLAHLRNSLRNKMEQRSFNEISKYTLNDRGHCIYFQPPFDMSLYWPVVTCLGIYVLSGDIIC